MSRLQIAQRFYDLGRVYLAWATDNAPGQIPRARRNIAAARRIIKQEGKQ